MQYRSLEERDHGPRKLQKLGRKPIISDDVIGRAINIAEINDLSKNSATSSNQILQSIDGFRRDEQDQRGLNSLSSPVAVSASTYKRAVRRVVPIRIRRGGIQNSSRQKALVDARNAISCAATWNAVAKDIDDGRQVHSWDELSIELNGFGKKIPVFLSKFAAQVVRKRNIGPSSTINQGKRRTFKIGISKYC